MTIYTAEAITNQESGIDVPPSIKGGRVRVAIGKFDIPANATDPDDPTAKTMMSGDLFIFAKLPSYATVSRIWCSWDGGAWSGGSTTFDVGLYFADYVKTLPTFDPDDSGNNAALRLTYIQAGFPLVKKDVLAANDGEFQNSDWHHGGADPSASTARPAELGIAEIECYCGDIRMDSALTTSKGDAWFENHQGGKCDRAGFPIWKAAERWSGSDGAGTTINGAYRPIDPSIEYESPFFYYLAGQIKSSVTATTTAESLYFMVFYTTD